MTTILDVPGINPPNPFSTLIKAFLTTDSTNFHAAANLVTIVTNSPDPAHALWELWDAFFAAVVDTSYSSSSSSSSSHIPLIALLEALRRQPPTQPSNVPTASIAERQLRTYTNADGKLYWPTLPRFSAQWSDTHGILEAWRDWDGVRVSGEGNSSSSGSEYFLRFCSFSAALLKASRSKDEAHPVPVFYACRKGLEHKSAGSHSSQDQPKPHRMSAKQLWALDVRIAAIWMRDGGQALWDMDREKLREHWAAALDDPTELWPREDGLTRERWQMWGDRLRVLSTSTENGELDDETRTLAKEAAEVVEAIVGRGPA